MNVLWRKAPLLLFRFPQLFGAIVVTAAIMATTAVAGPAFLVSTENASVRTGVDAAGRWTAGLQVGFEGYYSFAGRHTSDVGQLVGIRDRAERVLTERLSGLDPVGPPTTTLSGQEIEGRGPGGASRIRLVSRSKAEENVTVLERSGEPGVWIADVTARQLDLSVGDEIVLAGPTTRTTSPVAAIYRYLPEDTPRPYWAPLSSFIYRASGAFVDPPTFVLAGEDVYVDIAQELEEAPFVRLDFPLRTRGVSATELEDVAREFEAVEEELGEPDLPLADRIFEGVPLFGRNVRVDSTLPGIISTARVRVDTVTPVVDLLSRAARVLAISVMAAAGFYLVKKRRVEVVILAARGVGPLPQAARYGLEAAIPVATGGLVGAIAGFFLVKLLGPSSDLPLTLLQDGWREVIVTLLVGHAFLVISAAAAVAREEKDIADPAGSLASGRLLPLAGGAAALAASVLWQLRERVSAESEGQLRDPLLTILPVLLILMGGIAGSALLRAALPKIAQTIRYRLPPVYLAARRLTGASTMTLVLIVAVAWGLGIAIYGAAVSASVANAADAKAKLFIGSDYSGDTPPTYDLPRGLPVAATKVTQIVRASTTLGGQASILVIDPGTFAGAAFWQRDFADRPLADLVEDLDRASANGPAAIVSGGGADIDLGNRDGEAELEVTAVTRSFPGQRPDRPLIVVTRRGYEHLRGEVGGALGAPTHSVWAKGEPRTVERALRQAGVTIYSSVDAATVLDTPGLQSLLWVLGLLGAMGAAAALISVVGLLLYMQARERAALVSSALTRRMGLGRRRELASWIAEIGGALILSLTIALAVGLPVAEAMRTRLDPRPSLSPAPMLVVPAGVIAALIAAMATISVLSALHLRRTIDRADVAEVMRT